MQNLLTNWKTTLSGLAALITGISLIINGQTEAGIAAIITALGLFSAKDSNVTGGTKEQ
jgi:hypothetical protein